MNIENSNTCAALTLGSENQGPLDKVKDIPNKIFSMLMDVYACVESRV